jgi:hypothetical protein
MLHGFKLVHDFNILEDNLENEVKKKAQTKEPNTCLFVLRNSMCMIPSLRFCCQTMLIRVLVWNYIDTWSNQVSRLPIER